VIHRSEAPCQGAFVSCVTEIVAWLAIGMVFSRRNGSETSDWPATHLRTRAVADHWDDELESRPVRLSNGRELVTLRDAGDYIAKLPKRDQDSDAWQLAVRELLKAADGRGPWRFFAGLAIMRALYGRTKPPIGNPDNAPPAPKWRNQRKRNPWR